MRGHKSKNPAAPECTPRDARTRIVEAGLALLEAEGFAALSFREVARRAGVTHQAPYHHFADREGVLAAMLAVGFADLARRLHGAMDAALDASPEEAVVQVGGAYVAFGLERPRLFRVMFQRDFVELERYPEATAAAGDAYRALQRLVARVAPREDPVLHASLHWSMVHGLASLLSDGALGRALAKHDGRELHVRDVLRIFARSALGRSKATRGRTDRQTKRARPRSRR
jgi:AcrR family transcriptional regulator